MSDDQNENPEPQRVAGICQGVSGNPGGAAGP